VFCSGALVLMADAHAHMFWLLAANCQYFPLISESRVCISVLGVILMIIYIKKQKATYF
jgi:hypothetical protein